MSKSEKKLQTRASIAREPSPEYRSRGRRREIFDKSDPRYVPTRADLEEDVSIPDATPLELAQALMGNHPRRRVH
ncbi:MAG: hypothetical protein OXH69_10060 [Acidobacteria bacterium]|nr:hypothetical protein [Acidobacteriota bacterium]